MSGIRKSSAELTSLLGCLATGGISAVLFSFGLTRDYYFAFLLVYVAALPLLISGLGGGALKAGMAGLIGTAGTYVSTLNLMPAVLYFVVYALPTFGLVAMAMRRRLGEGDRVFWYPEGRLLIALTLYPCGLFLIASIYAFAVGQDDGLLGLSVNALHSAFAQLQAQNEDMAALTTGPDGGQAFIAFGERVAQVMPSLFGYCWLCIMLLSVLSAQGYLAKRNATVRPPFGWHGVDVPQAFLVVVAVIGSISYLLPHTYAYIGFNLLALLFFPLIMAGTGVIHGYASTLRMRKLFLFFFYFVFAMVPWLAPLIAVLGAADVKFHFRQRFAQLPHINK